MASFYLSARLFFRTLVFGLAITTLASCNESETRERREKREKPREARLSSANYMIYMARLHRQVKHHWLPNIEAGKSGAVLFTATRAGQVKGLEVSRSSGDRDFDRAMLESINASAPLPPLPAGAPQAVPMEFTFDRHVYDQLIKGEADEVKQSLLRIDRLITSKPEADHYYERGKLWLQLGEKEKAVEDFSQAIDRGRADAEILIARAKANSARGNYKASLSDCAAILKIDSNNSKNREAYVLQSEAYLNLGQISQALAAAKLAIAAAPQHPDGYTARAYAYNLAGSYRKAIDDCNTALSFAPQCSAAYAYRGDAEEELQAYDQALKDYGKTIELDPLDGSALLRRAELYNQIGQFHRAIVDCTDAIKIDADNGEAYFHRSYANAQLSLTAQAKKDRERAESLGFVGQ